MASSDLLEEGGEFVALTVDDVGDVLVGSHTSGTTTLQLSDVSDFDEDGGKVSVSGVTYSYSSADMALDQIVLTSGLTSTQADATPVILFDDSTGLPSVEYSALVRLASQDDGDVFMVAVDHALAPLLKTGIRNGRQSVSVKPDGDGYRLVAVHGKEAIQESITYLPGGFTTRSDPSLPGIDLLGSQDVPPFDQGGLISFSVVGSGWTPGNLTAAYIAGPPNVGTLTLVGPMGPGGTVPAGLGLSYATGGTGSIASLDAKSVGIGASATAGIELLNATSVVNGFTAGGGYTLSGGGVINGAFTNNAGITITGASNSLTISSPPTTGVAANAVIGGSGLISKSTSSRRYKKNIKDVTFDADAVLALKPRQFQMRTPVEGEEGMTHVGFIAEEADDLGLTQFVTYNDEGQPDAFQYPLFCVAQQQVLKDQQERIERLEQLVADLAGS